MTGLSLSLLGPFEARLGGVDIGGVFRTEKERALLAYLAAERDRAHSREFLAELLWPERSDGVGRTNLRQALSGVRRALREQNNPSPFLDVSDEFIQFDPESPFELDTLAFTRHLNAALYNDHPQISACPDCLNNLRQAVDLYRGDFLSGMQLPDSPDFQEWTLFRREQYFGHLLVALQQLSEAYMAQGEWEQALQVALRQVQTAPLEEGGHRLLMYLLAVGGRRSSALEQFQTCRRLLREQLRVEPAAETVELYEKIRRGETLPLPGRGKQSGSGPALPAQLTNFIGRESELEWIGECLSNPVCRLITLTGAPGVGKTRLALQSAETRQEAFPDGVHFIPLEQADPGVPLARHLAQALQLLPKSHLSESEQLFEYLREKNALLILDSLEDFQDQAHLLIQILKKAPRVKFLVTSSRRLNFQTACVTPIHGLAYPQDEQDGDLRSYPAVRLFLDRAARSRPTFRLDQHTRASVVEICRRVDGLPLGLELAAQRLRTHTSQQVARELEHNLEFLLTNLPDFPERQRSMSASFEPAWQRLPEDEQAAFRRLAVFPAGFSQQAAETITEVEQCTLFDLADRSLLQPAAAQRFHFHPLMRLFAGQKLAEYPQEAEDLHERHAHYFLNWLEAHVRTLQGAAPRPAGSDPPEQPAVQIQKELANLQQAADWSIQRGQVQAAAGFIQAFLALQDRLAAADLETLRLSLHLSLEKSTSLSQADRFYLYEVLEFGGQALGAGAPERDKPAILVLGPDEQIVDLNPAAARLTGLRPAQLLEMDWKDLLAQPAPLPAFNGEFLLEAKIAAIGRPACRVEAAFAPHTHTPGNRLLVLREVEAAAESEPQPAYDPLTGLPGRLVFADRLEHAMALADRGGGSLAVLQLSLNNLPELRSRLSPELSKAVIQTAARRLKDCLRRADTVARCEAESFCVLLENLGDSRDVRVVAHKVLAALAEPVLAGGEPVFLDISIGGSRYPSSRSDAEDLIRAARAGMLLAQALGGSGYYLAS